MVVATLAAIALVVLVALNVGVAMPVTVMMAVGMVLLGATSIVPLLGRPIVTPENWGLVVMGVGIARTTMAMIVILSIQGSIESVDSARKHVALALLGGAVIMMMAEATVAVILLAKRDATRRALLDTTNETRTSTIKVHGSLH